MARKWIPSFLQRRKAQGHQVFGEPVPADSIAFFGTNFRRGMWVVDQRESGNYIGVLTNILMGSTAEVEYADEDGCRVLAIQAPLNRLRQATYLEIPAPRRPSHTNAHKLGYGGPLS